MAIFNLFKRLGSQNAAGGERRTGDRVRTTLGARVLVVDDSATIRAVLGKMLTQDGYEALKAADGESAVEMAQSQLPDLIFLDIVLPGISGFAVLRSLRRDSHTQATPIIMMSGNQQATEQFYVQRFGADGFIKKPFGRAEVFHAIRSLVQAGRMPGRTETASMTAIPEGMTVEEWNAIPDVGMPDAAHMGTSPLDSVATETSAGVAGGKPIEAAAAVPATMSVSFSISEFSARMRPTLAATAATVLGASPDVAHAPGQQAAHRSAQDVAADDNPERTKDQDDA
jgi:twitching motility two-component system response regulator PilH